MPTMRAKMRVSRVQSNKYSSPAGDGKTTSERVEFQCVAKSEGCPADGSDENNTFARWTPNGNAMYDIQNPDLFGKFQEGQEFYVDFTPAT